MAMLFSPGGTAQTSPLINKFVADINIAQIMPGADTLGALRGDTPVYEVLTDGTLTGYIFLTSDFVSTTGYSGKPIHVLVAVDLHGIVTGARLVKHSEPIVLVGIPEKSIRAVIDKYRGLDLVVEANSTESTHDLQIVSGATVTVMIIDDSILRSGLKVARSLGLGGLQPLSSQNKPGNQVIPYTAEDAPLSSWRTLEGDGSIRSLRLDTGQVNRAFIETADPLAIARPLRGDPADTFINMHLALVSVPEIGRTLLGEHEYANLLEWLDDGDSAILVLGTGQYSFKGSGYVRGGIFDRIQLIQNQSSIRFRDKIHRRFGQLHPTDAPTFKERDLFKIPAMTEFEATEPFRLQLLVQRAVGAIEKRFITFDLGYQVPSRHLQPVAASVGDSALQAGEPGSAVVHHQIENTDPDGLSHLWTRIWWQKRFEVAVLAVAITLLTAVFFFQMQVTRHARFTYWFRTGFLVFTLVGLGWYANAQLSIVNVLTFFAAITTSFSWSAFLMDPLIFILWGSVAASLLFWGRGVFCGWLCPFGALQELSNQIARHLRVPQIRMPWGLHERLWPIKYMIFLSLFGISLYSLEMAERVAEIEPFKTAIILKFQRNWPYVLFVVALLTVGLFIERFYCRYLCPLGAALAIPARMRIFNWLKRYRSCGNPCRRCANECIVQAIHPEGDINPNECHQCLQCQVLYQSKTDCPVVIKLEKKRGRWSGSSNLPESTTASTAAPTARGIESISGSS